jgi:hypothetical protein
MTGSRMFVLSGLALAAALTPALAELATAQPGAGEPAAETRNDGDRSANGDEAVEPAARKDWELAGLGEGQPPVYVPPRRGAPVTRVGGGTRSGPARGEARVPVVELLSPEHTGLTRQPSPTLYWFLSDHHDGPIEIVVLARDTVRPVLRTRLEGGTAAGVHALALGEHGVVLETETVYQWAVSLVRDDDRRSRDVVSIATLERIGSEAADQAVTTAELAAAGVWYDAIDAVSRALAHTPDQRKARAALLEQVGLDAAAAWDRHRAGATGADTSMP